MYTGTGSDLRIGRSAAVHFSLHFDSPTHTRVNSDSCVNDGYCLRLFSVDYGAFDLFFPFPKSNSASQYGNDDGQRPTSIVDLTARVPCRFFYFRGARQL